MDGPYAEQTNLGRLYKARFEAVVTLFQAEDVAKDAYRSSCI